MEIDIYIRRDGEQFGPYPKHEIRWMFVQGTLLPTDLVWHEGQRDWIPLKEFLGIQDAVVPQSEPDSTSVIALWLTAGIIVASLALFAELLIHVRWKTPATPASLDRTVSLLDTNAAPIIQTPSTANTFRSPIKSITKQAEDVSVTTKIQVASQPMNDSQSDAALNALSATLKSDPQNLYAYLNRAAIYSQKKVWLQAEADYKAALQIDANNFVARFNMAEIKFQKKEYDAARADFIAMQDDSENGDLVRYKTYLCDLFNGNENMAAKELGAFNQVGENASYYFGNAAWDLYHKKVEDAREWLASANRIYSPQKCSLYGASLQDLGYLPLSPAPQ